MEARRRAGLAARVLLALLSVGVLAAAGSGWVLQQQLRTDTVTSNALTPRSAPIPEGEPFTALLVGLDARTDAAGNPLPPQLLDALHAGADEGQLHTDTMILLRVPGRSGGPATAISIPRDSYVPIVGERGKHKINSAYRRGVDEAQQALSAEGVTGTDLDRRSREAGRQKLIASVENLTGTTIDHYAEINLAGFVELTDALGGVSVCLNTAVRDSYSGIDLPAGQQSLSGAAALAFVRQRHGLDGGDLDRIGRQQAFAAGLAARCPTPPG
jgi:LCP family protein required for cell wall assembly